MDGMLSQEEINALLNGMGSDSSADGGYTYSNPELFFISPQYIVGKSVPFIMTWQVLTLISRVCIILLQIC